MTPKEKAIELIDKMYNTEHCGIKHIPNKRYCDCSEINMFQAKQCALIAVNEIIPIIESYEDALSASQKSDALDYWNEVKQEINKL